MKLYNVLYFIILSSLFIGCSASTPSSPKIVKQLPQWYTSPPKNTDRFSYATAISTTKEEAVAKALQEIISQLNISIKSSFKSQKTISNGHYTSKIQNNIETEISKITINNYEIINFYRQRYNQYLVQIKVDKSKWLEYLKATLKKEFEQFSIVEKSAQNYHHLRQLDIFKNLHSQAKSQLSKITIIKALDHSFDERYYDNKINSYQKKYLEIEKNLSVEIVNKSNQIFFTEKLKSYFTKQKIKLNYSHTKVALFVTEKRIKNEYLDMIIFTITLKTYFNDRLIGNNEFEIKAHNKGDMNRIRQKASVEFLEVISEKEIKSLLNI
ncbi:MAG: LPP20 family lipoprotein [Arcobacteraceae bacterium]